MLNEIVNKIVMIFSADDKKNVLENLCRAISQQRLKALSDEV